MPPLPGLPVPPVWEPRCLRPGYSLRMDRRKSYLCRGSTVVAVLDRKGLADLLGRPLRLPDDVDDVIRAAMFVDEVAQALAR